MFYPNDPKNQQPSYMPQDYRQDILDPSQMAQMPGIAGMHADNDAYVDQSSGAVPFVFDLLWQEYARSIKRKLDERRAAGGKVKSLDEALKHAPASHFFNFCSQYLAVHRPVQQFAADANLGFMLANNVRALLCPPVADGYAGHGGQMQHAHAVGVTHGHSQPGMGGVLDGGGIPII